MNILFYFQYSVLLFLLLVSQIILGVLVLTNKHQLEQAFEKLINNFWKERDSHQNFWDTLQKSVSSRVFTKWGQKTPWKLACCYWRFVHLHFRSIVFEKKIFFVEMPADLAERICFASSSCQISCNIFNSPYTNKIINDKLATFSSIISFYSSNAAA